MPGTASYLNAHHVLLHTALIEDGDFSTPVGVINIGKLKGSSEIGDFEVTTESYMAGEARVAASIRHVLRTMGSVDEADITTLNTAADGNPPTQFYLYFVNQSLTGYQWQGPGDVFDARAEGVGTEPKRRGTVVGFSAKGDTPEDISGEITAAVTLPA